MQKVIVSVSNDFVTDQRVQKVCNSLVQSGFSVEVICRKLKNSLPLSDYTYKVTRLNLFFNKGFLFYAELNTRLFFKLLLAKKHILLANDLDTLLPNYLASKLSSKKLVFDSHELFSETPELVERKSVKNFWLSLEKALIPKLKNCYTVSESIANYYKQKYNADFKVVRNAPYREENLSKETNLKEKFQDKKLIIYQGAVNKGRGLELAISAMKYLENTVLLIIGGGDILSKLKQQVTKEKLTDKVHFLGKIEPKVLKKLSVQAAIGISLEEDLGLNYRYALPNKLFDYIQAKIPVLVSDLPEMKTIVETYKVGEVLIKRIPKNLAKKLSEMLEKGKNNWKNELETAAKELVWEHEENSLVGLFRNLKD